MSLSASAPRESVHLRRIHCQGYRREDGLWDVEGTLTDTKSYAYESTDRGRVDAGEPVHDMHLRLTVDDDLAVLAVEAVTTAGPFTICGDIMPVYARLVGARIGLGWRHAVLKRFGGIRGCTHLTDMLLGPIAATAFQAVRPRHPTVDDKGREPEAAPRPALLDTCHALASNSPVTKRKWPDFYTEPRDRPTSSSVTTDDDRFEDGAPDPPPHSP